MEPDDLSFIEISGEDDSLLPLQHISNDGVSSLNNTYLACSPLQIPRSACAVNPSPLVSPIVGITGNWDAAKLDLSSNKDSVNNENASLNKPEVPKLNMEPQSMKRKKKGGYNLRKSLAWNKAFFTEEGVLDPTELSMISGNSSNSSGAMLSVIEEDGSESLAGNSENLFKESPANFLSEDGKSSGAFLPKNGSPARVSVASASVSKVVEKGTNSNCSEYMLLRASGRPANANTTKSTNKESKVSKVPARKLDTSVHSATAKNNIPVASNMKRNQISQPAVSVQKNVGSKAASNRVKSARSDARSGSTGRFIAVKSSVQQARRNVTNSSLEKHSSTKSQHPIINKTKNTLKIDTAPPLLTSANVLNNHDGASRKVQISLPSDGSMQYAQTQTAKPSGLRMPSPSLGFFNQSKASTSHVSLPRINQACNVLESNIPNFRKFDSLNTTHEKPISAPEKVPDMANGVTATDTRIPKSIKGSFIPTSLITVQKVELEVPFNSNTNGSLSKQRKFSLCYDIDQEALPNVGPSENENISQVVNNESKSNDNKLLFHRALSDQLKNDDDDDEKSVADIYPTNMELSGKELENPQFSSHLRATVQIEGIFKTKDMIDNQCVEEKACTSFVKNSAISSELQSEDVISDGIIATLKEQDDWLGSVHDVNEQSRKQDEEMVPCIKHVSTKVIRSSEFHNCETTKTADGNPEVRLCSGGEAESSHGRRHPEDTVEAKDCVPGIDNICTKSEGSDVLDKMVVDDVTQNVNGANGSELTSSGALCLIPPATKDCGFHMAEIADCPHGDDTISGFIDAQLSHEIKLHGLTNSGESEIIGKDQSINMATTTIVEVSNVCLNTGDFIGCECDLQHFETQPSAMLQTGNGIRVNDRVAAIEVQSGYVINDPNKQKGVESKLNNCRSNSDLQPADGISFCQHTASTTNNDQLSAMHTVCRQSMEHNPSPTVSDKLLSEVDSSYHQRSTSTHNDQLSSMHMFCQQSVGGIPQASDKTLCKDGMPFEESRESYAGNVADISLDVKSCSGRGPESHHDEFQQEHVEQGNEEIGSFDNKMKKSLVEDEQMQVLEGSILADSCASKFNPVVADDVYEQSRVHSELHTLNSVAVRGSLDNHESCLNDKLIVNNCSSEEYEDNNDCGNLMDDILEQSDACANESNSFIICTEVAAAVRDDGIDEDEKADCPCGEDGDVQNTGNNLSKSDVLPEEASVSQNNGSSNCEIKNEFKSPILATEDSTMSSLGGVFQDTENILKSDVLSGDAENSISQKNGNPYRERLCELEDAIHPIEDLDGAESLGKTEIDEKQDNLVIKPPPHAAPFSDEWLAAFETAGEEILTMKGGAVQHSPPDKSLPEPGPWSPVKRKNNQGIGPFDCTKFTNCNINTPSNSA
ncbi:hypothetical protein KPL71_024811 [Citrus sinensis]|uniref:Uncharacterized protein n=1 Tax=Citrus sinensis TaxID=2711 RepID=A0ACB8IUU4_CITSI|nr:hypothetical protein KPL71_024811 [Citrus sinensis]